MIFLDWPAEGESDPYWANVTLLVQGGTDGGMVIQDLSSYGSTATINSGSAFTDDQQVFGANTIRPTVYGADIDWFSASGLGSRFTRPAGEAMTIEAFVHYTSLDNRTGSWIFLWDDSSGRILEMGFGNDLGALRLRITDAVPLEPVNLDAAVTHFIQFTVIGDTYYLDVGEVPGDGTTTQVATGTMFAPNSASDTNFRVGRHFVVDSTASVAGLWITPLRVTKGVARPRGYVPTTDFPTH